MCHMLSILFLTLHDRDFYSIFHITNALIETLHAPSCPPFKQVSLTYSVFLMSTSAFVLHYPPGELWESFQKVLQYLGVSFNKKHKQAHIIYIAYV